MRRTLLGVAVVLISVSLAAPAGAAKGSKPPDVKGAQQRANAAAARLASAESALAQAETSFRQVQAKTRDVEGRVGQLESKVKAAALRQYLDGGRSLMWLSTDDFSRAGRARAMLEVVTHQDTESIDEYRAAKADLDSSTAALDRQLADRKKAAANFRQERTKAAAELGRLSKLAAAYEAQLKAQKKASAKAQPKTVGARSIAVSGPWACPVQGPRAFSNDWGQPRSGGRSHQGNDILAPRGTPVVASVSGSVKHHRSGLGGLAYYLHGDDGITYYGAHLDSFGASGRVSAGDVVGTVGTSGNASGGPAHLHFEMHPGNGRAVNPYSVLRQYC